MDLINFMNFMLSPLQILKPHLTIFILAVSLTVIANLLNKIFIRKKKVREIKKRMAFLREKVHLAEKMNRPEELKKIFNEFVKINKELLKINLLSLLFPLLIIILFFPWLSSKFSGRIVAVLPFSLPFLGNSLDWLVWYVLVSLMVGWLIRNLFGD